MLEQPENIDSTFNMLQLDLWKYFSSTLTVLDCVILVNIDPPPRPNRLFESSHKSRSKSGCALCADFQIFGSSEKYADFLI